VIADEGALLWSCNWSRNNVIQTLDKVIPIFFSSTPLRDVIQFPRSSILEKTSILSKIKQNAKLLDIIDKFYIDDVNPLGIGHA